MLIKRVVQRFPTTDEKRHNSDVFTLIIKGIPVENNKINVFHPWSTDKSHY